MAERIRITPRAARAARAAGLDPRTLNIAGTGYAGGVCEKDIESYLKREPAGAGASPRAAGGARITPLARKIANAAGLDIATLTGSGSGGKITRADVQAARVSSSAPAVQAATTAAGTAENGEKVVARTMPYSGVRKIIGERLAMSKFTAPHLYFTQKVNLDRLLAVREEINAAQDKKTSVTDYIAVAVTKCLLKYPEMNASLIGENIEEYANVNLGIAVAAPSGLIVPVVKNAQSKSLIDLSKAASALFDKARDGKLTPDEYSGGTFTISNLGMFGIENFTAIINPPESGILAISATKDEPLVREDEAGNKVIAICRVMNITLTVDHRLIDGLLAARFVTEVKRLLESPIELLI